MNGFLDRERARIHSAMIEATGTERERLWGAQQALAWATDPGVFASPMRALTDTPQGEEDYPSICRRRPSSDIP